MLRAKMRSVLSTSFCFPPERVDSINFKHPYFLHGLQRKPGSVTSSPATALATTPTHNCLWGDMQFPLKHTAGCLPGITNMFNHPGKVVPTLILGICQALWRVLVKVELNGLLEETVTAGIVVNLAILAKPPESTTKARFSPLQRVRHTARPAAPPWCAWSHCSRGKLL